MQKHPASLMFPITIVLDLDLMHFPSYKYYIDKYKKNQSNKTYMESTQSTNEIEEHLGLISEELTKLRKITIGLTTVDKIKAERAWKDLMDVSRQISREWKGPSALDEIRSQR